MSGLAVVTDHAVERFRERFDDSVSKKEAIALIKLAFDESTRELPKEIEAKVKRKRQIGYCYLYHKIAGLLLVVQTNSYRRPVVRTLWRVPQC